MVIVYPAIFQVDERGGYYIQFPDIEGTGTQGKDIKDAMEMASDYLGMMLADLIESEEEIPTPTDVTSIDTTTGEFTTLVTVDLSQYMKDLRMDRTNITIPHWLKKRAEKKGINISKVTTAALMNELEVV